MHPPWSEKPLGKDIDNYHIYTTTEKATSRFMGGVQKKKILFIIVFNYKIIFKIQIYRFLGCYGLQF